MDVRCRCTAVCVCLSQMQREIRTICKSYALFRSKGDLPQRAASSGPKLVFVCVGFD